VIRCCCSISTRSSGERARATPELAGGSARAAGARGAGSSSAPLCCASVVLASRQAECRIARLAQRRSFCSSASLRVAKARTVRGGLRVLVTRAGATCGCKACVMPSSKRNAHVSRGERGAAGSAGLQAGPIRIVLHAAAAVKALASLSQWSRCTRDSSSAGPQRAALRCNLREFWDVLAAAGPAKAQLSAAPAAMRSPGQSLLPRCALRRLLLLSLGRPMVRLQKECLTSLSLSHFQATSCIRTCWTATASSTRQTGCLSRKGSSGLPCLSRH